eukprot:TRINITY_DN5778_c0_g1_i11.p1 TRINITY_DN5778_c0_g1~~TRINITY_DN5778_c0_g1_i11.p1  ORF type:complete len:305 (-),score=22.36 TRINITY_DN5778_c0_g1_i11:12-926(-)
MFQTKLFVGSNAFRVSYWDLNDSSLTRVTLEGHKHNIPCIQVSPCGRFLASVSIDKGLRVWDINSHKLLCIFPRMRNWGWSIVWIPRRTIKHYAAYKTVTQYKHKLRENPKYKKGSSLYSLAKYFILSTDKNRIYLFDPLGEENLSEINIEDDSKLPIQMHLVNQLDNGLDFMFQFAQILRYALTSYLNGLSLVVAAVQNTPFVHLAHLEYDLGSLGVKLIPAPALPHQRGLILGMEVIEVPSSISYISRYMVYFLLDSKIIDVYEFSTREGSDMKILNLAEACLLYTSPSPRDGLLSRMPSSA